MWLKRYAWVLLGALSCGMGGCQEMREMRADRVYGLFFQDGGDIEMRRLAFEAIKKKQTPEAQRAMYQLICRARGQWEDRFWQEVLGYLVERDQEEFREKMGKLLHQISSERVRSAVMLMGAKRGWRDWTAGIVRSLRRVDLKGNPNQWAGVKALKKLYPGQTLERVVLEVFRGKAGIVPQIEAWEVWVRLVGRQEAMAYLRVSKGTSLLESDLRAGLMDLGVLVRHREELIWLGALRAPRHAVYYRRLKALAKALSNAQREGLCLRHLGVLAAADRAALSLDVKTLAEKVGRQLRAKQHFQAGVEPGDWVPSHAQQMQALKQRLSWGDWLSLSYLLDHLNGQLVANLFKQAYADQKDKAREYGGVMRIISTRGDGKGADHIAHHGAHARDKRDAKRMGGVFGAVGYGSVVKGDDLRFSPSLGMMEDLYVGLFHYHFHAQDFDRRKYAGPGQLDLALAQRLGAGFVVLAFVQKGVLNVDYYIEGGVVVDLGCVRER